MGGFWYYTQMPKTRDLVIIVAVLLALCIGIAVTLIAESIREGGEMPSMTTFSDAVTDVFTAEAPDTHSLNRKDIIARLRTALSQNITTVEPSPSVEAVEPTPDIEDVTTPQAGVQRCEVSDDASGLSGSWPLSGVSLRVHNAVREVVSLQTAPVVDLNASSSTAASSSASYTTLLVIPLVPSTNGIEYCVPSDVVGVTTSGSLMFNSDAAFYRGYGSEYLIGYARDGYPIYGYYEGELDTCGGYMHPSGYRYSVSADRDYLIGCYTAAPASFVAQ